MVSLEKKRKLNSLANLGWKSLSSLFVIFSIFLMFLIIVFMIIQIDPIASTQNVVNDVIFGSKYNIKNEEYGLAIPLLMTILTTFLSLLFAVPLSIRCAIFIVFRLKNKKVKKTFRSIIELLAGIPSIVFGLFSLTIFGDFLKNIFGMESSRNLLTAFLTLSFMIMPLITTLSINSLENAKKYHWDAAIALGSSPSSIIYNIIKPAAKKGIIVGIIVATTRALGESMALSIILQGTASNYNSLSIAGFFNNDTPTLASLTARDFLGGDASAEILPSLRGAFFSGGIAFFVMVFILNIIILGVTREYSWSNSLKVKFKWYRNKLLTNVRGRSTLLKLELAKGRLAYIPTRSNWDFSSVQQKKPWTNEKEMFQNFDYQFDSFLKISKKWNVLRFISDNFKLILEIISIFLVFVFISWIVVDTLVIKASLVFSQPQYVFGSIDSSLSGNSIGATIVTTLILILLVLALSFPIALLVAIYMKEYTKSNSKWTHIARFFIDALGSTPSIFFGIFGLVFFIETLNIYNPNKSFASSSILAGGLTMMIVVLPTLIRAIEAALDNVPKSYKLAAIALGIPKWKVIYKIVVPAAMVGISTSIILTIGRILSETAPIYLTLGLSPNRPWFPDSNMTLLENGQTLTSRIYANIAFSSSSSDYLIAYEAAFFCVLLIIFLNSLNYMLININWKKILKFK